MNKKGELTSSELLGIIIAVLGLTILFFAIWKLYAVSVSNEGDNVNNILNVIKTRIENLKDNESGKFLISGQEGWFLTGWSKDEAGRPDKCYFNSCICACKGEPVRAFYSGERIDNRKNVCQEKGFCREMEKDIVKIIGVEPIGYIGLQKNTIEIEINKTKLELIIRQNA